MTTVHHVGIEGSIWSDRAGSQDPLEILRYMLANYALDPTFTTLADGCYRFRSVDTSENGPTVHFWGNFADASCVFSIDTDEHALIEDLAARIEANMSTPLYRQACLDRHHSIVAKAKEEARREEIRQDQREARARSILNMRKP